VIIDPAYMPLVGMIYLSIISGVSRNARRMRSQWRNGFLPLQRAGIDLLSIGGRKIQDKVIDTNACRGRILSSSSAKRVPCTLLPQSLRRT